LRKGFTLIELIVTIAIMVAMGAMIWITASRATRYSKQTSVVSVANFIAEQLKRRYELEGAYPANDNQFKDFLKDTRYFETVPKNALWYGNPEDGWNWIQSSSTLQAINYTNKVVYSIILQAPNVSPANIYTRPNTYGGDGG